MLNGTTKVRAHSVKRDDLFADPPQPDTADRYFAEQVPRILLIVEHGELLRRSIFGQCREPNVHANEAISIFLASTSFRTLLPFAQQRIKEESETGNQRNHTDRASKDSCADRLQHSTSLDRLLSVRYRRRLSVLTHVALLLM